MVEARDQLGASTGERRYPELIGESEAMLKLYWMLDHVVASDSTVLIQGENGTGKELCARAIHQHSARQGAFVAQNCSAFVDNLLDSVATPAAVIAGAIVTASVVGDISPMLRWALAIIAGGGVAGTVQTSTVLLRGASSVSTGGVGNPVINTAEVASSFSLSMVTLFIPLVAAVAVLGTIFWLGRKLRWPGKDETADIEKEGSLRLYNEA